MDHKIMKCVASLFSAIFLWAVLSTAVFAATPGAAETLPAGAAKTSPAKDTDHKLEYNGTVSKKLLDAGVETELEFDVYLLEPVFMFEPYIPLNLKPIRVVMDLSKERLVLRAALDPDEKEIIWIVIKGSDYSNISRAKRSLLTMTYKRPAKLKGMVLRSDDVAQDLEQMLSSEKVLEFISLDEQVRIFDESAAVEFRKNRKNDTEAYVDNIRDLTLVTYTYRIIGEKMYQMDYLLDYLIFEATLNDGKGTSIYIAFEPDVYVKDIDPSVSYEFDKNEYFYKSRLKGNFTKKMYDGSGLSLYGYTADAEEISNGLSETTGKRILIYDHIKK